MKTRWFSVLAIVIALGLMPVPARAQGHGQGKGQGNGHGKGDKEHGNPHGKQDRDGDEGRGWERREGYEYRAYEADGRPPGWSHGRKTGWGNCGMPPGQAKKYGCRSYLHQGRTYYYYQGEGNRIFVRRPIIQLHGSIDIVR